MSSHHQDLRLRLLLSFCPSMCAQPQEEDLCKVTDRVRPNAYSFPRLPHGHCPPGSRLATGHRTDTGVDIGQLSEKASHQLSPRLWVGRLGLFDIWQGFPCLALGG